MQYNICDFGALPGEAHNVTAAIQNAIDTCAGCGGGVVNVPAGKFYTDMLTLRDDVELHLETGATLVSLLERIPEDRDDYEEPSFNMKRYLIGGVKVHNAAITGYGTIDGRGYLNFWNLNDGYEHPLYGQRYWPLTHRPRALVHFRESSNIRIENITLLEPPAYNVWLLGCDRCDIKGVRIRTDLKGPNNDGLDIDCCSNIYITGCDIVTNDDAIGIFSDINTLGYDKPCENIVVSDCRIKAISDGIRIGYVGDGIIRNVTIGNTVIFDSMIGISMMVAISPDDCRGVYIKYGPKISQINFNNLIIDAEEPFNFQTPKNGSSKPVLGFMDGVYLSNITATARRGSFFGGVPERPLGRIEIANLHLTLTGEMGTDFEHFVPQPYPVWTDMITSGIPYPFFIRYADDFTVKNSSIRYQNASGAWQKRLFAAEHAEPVFENVSFTGKVTDPVTTEFPVDRSGALPRFAAWQEKPLAGNAQTLMLPWCPTEKLWQYTAGEWEAFFAGLQQEGIQNAVLPALVNLELYTCYYASSRYSELKSSMLLDKLLKAGAKFNIRVFAGSCFSSVPFRQHVSAAAWEKELLEQRCTLSEVYRLPEIAGFVIPLEVFDGVKVPENFAARAVELCRNFKAALTDRNDTRPVILPVSENIPPEVYGKILDAKAVDALAVAASSSRTAQFAALCGQKQIKLISFISKEF